MGVLLEEHLLWMETQNFSPDTVVTRRQAIGYFVDPMTQWDTPYLGGETYRGLRARVWPFFADLLQRSDWRRVVVVAHGGVNNALIGQILGTAEPGLANIEQDLMASPSR